MSNILITSESRYPVRRKKIKEAVDRFLAEQKITSEVEVSIAIVGDRKMKMLNKKYRDKEGTTPVLTFSLSEPGSPACRQGREHGYETGQPQKTTSFEAKFINVPDEVMRLGDIVISYPQTVLSAAAEEKMVDQVLAEFVEHGLRNLLGLN